jgi:hypothetical protein
LYFKTALPLVDFHTEKAISPTSPLEPQSPLPQCRLTVNALWAIVSAVLGIFLATHLSKGIPGDWIHGLIGPLSILIGIVLVAQPEVRVSAVAWLVGIDAVMFGILLGHLGLKVKEIKHMKSWWRL